MKQFARIFGLFIRSQPRAFWLGLGMTALALMAGAALLGLSGWFITASALAGLAGTGLTFDFFRPSAGVRFFALLRTASRYGERLSTHDATLKFLAALRVSLLSSFARLPFAVMARLRGAVTLSRLTSDVDALDQLYVRVLAPLLALASALILSALIISSLAGPVLGLFGPAVYMLAAALMFMVARRLGQKPSRRYGYGVEALRLRFVDLRYGLVDLVMAGQLPQQAKAIEQAGAYSHQARWQIERSGQLVSFIGMIATALAVSGTVALAAELETPVALAAIAVFTCLGLGEGLMAWHRGVIELGRAQQALARMKLSDTNVAQTRLPAREGVCEIRFEQVSLRRRNANAPVIDGFNQTIGAGEWLALVGPSGAGKSTVLALLAGMEQPSAGAILVDDTPLTDLSEAQLRATIGILPQNAKLVHGTVGDNLRLAAPNSDEAAMWAALKVACLDEVIAAKGGLDFALGEGGAGLSGGEARRLCLARLVLRDTPVMLLDEPTAGLNESLAAQVMRNLRATWCDKIVLIAAHAQLERAVTGREVQIIPKI